MPPPKPAVPSRKKGTIGKIVAVTFKSDHLDTSGKKLIRPSAGDFADATAVFKKPEWDDTRGGNFDPHPISHTKALNITIDVDIELTVTPPGRTGLLTAIKGTCAGHDFLTFELTLSQPIKSGKITKTLVSKDTLPNSVSFEDHGVSWTAVVDGMPVDLGSTLHRVYVTFDKPIGKMDSTVANSFTETGKDQDVTEERLAFSVNASLGKGVSDGKECVDAVFLRIGTLGVGYFLGRRWEPDPLNNTGLSPKPPLHQYLWKCNANTAKGECHNIAASFTLACRVLGVTGPFEIGFMYPRPSRLETHPTYNKDPNAKLGFYSSGDGRYFRTHSGLSHGVEQLVFLDGSLHANNFEGVSRYKDGLYAIGDAIFDLDPADPQKNAAMYYGIRGSANSAGRPTGIDLTHGLFDLVFVRVGDDGCKQPYPWMTNVEAFTQPNGNILTAVRFKWHN